MDDTYIKLYRKTLDWGWFTEVSTCHLFIYLLLRAQYNEKEYKGTVVPQGELVTSLSVLKSQTGLSVRQIRTALKNLEKTNEIEVKTTNKFTRIKVNKWGDYQCLDDDIDKQKTNERQAKDKRTTTIKESKESENIFIKEKIYKKEKSQLELAMDDFKEMRKSIRKPMTEKAEQMILKKLQTLAPDNEEGQIAIINQSIENCWTSVYPLPEQRGVYRGREEKPIEHDDSNNPTFSQEDMDKLLERRKKLERTT